MAVINEKEISMEEENNQLASLMSLMPNVLKDLNREVKTSNERLSSLESETKSVVARRQSIEFVLSQEVRVRTNDIEGRLLRHGIV